MTTERLSALDASFLAVETPAAPMHVGWVSTYDLPEDGSRPRFPELFEHLAGRFAHAPRWRRKLAPVPLGITEPAWADDPDFDPAEHLLHARGSDLDAIVDEIFSEPLPRDRPLWQIWIAGELDDSVVLIGKAHHCMVDGIAIVELGKLLLDAGPRRGAPRGRGVGAGAGALVAASGSCARSPTARPTAPRSCSRRSSSRARRAAARRARGLARTLQHTLLPPAPGSALNRAGSPAPPPRAHVAPARRAADDPAALRRHAQRRRARRLRRRAAALRRAAAAEGHGARGRARRRRRARTATASRSCSSSCRATSRIRSRASRRSTPRPRAPARGEAEDLDGAFRALALAPTPLKHVLAHAFAHPRMSNLTISSVPGPAHGRYMLGCKLRSVHSAVPLTERHALSIGSSSSPGQRVLRGHRRRRDAAGRGRARRRPRRGVRRAAQRRCRADARKSRAALTGGDPAGATISPIRPPRERRSTKGRDGRRTRIPCQPPLTSIAAARATRSTRSPRLDAITART